MMFLILGLIYSASGGVNLLPPENRYQYKEAEKKVVKQEISTKISSILKDVGVKKKKKKRVVFKPISKVLKRRIPALTTLNGTVYTSIVATNSVPESFYITIPEGSNYVAGARLRCIGSAGFKRILAGCDTMVTPDGKEYFNIKAKVTDLDGTKGIIPDHYYTSEWENFTLKSFGIFMEGALETLKTPVRTVFGYESGKSDKDAVLGGLSKIAQKGRGKIEEGERTLYVAVANRGKKVLVHFELGSDL